MESIEKYNERLENVEFQLKQKLKDFHEYMPVRTNDNERVNVRLLQIYCEWMDFLAKKSAKKNQDDLLNKRKDLLVTYSPDMLAELVIELFYAKRNYQKWKSEGKYKQASADESKRISEKLRIYNDDLVNRLLSSYSGAEKRVRKKVKEWKVLGNTSMSLVKLLSLAKDESQKDDSSHELGGQEEPKVGTGKWYNESAEKIETQSSEKEEKNYWAAVQLEIEFPEESPEESIPKEETLSVTKIDYSHDSDVNQNSLYDDKDWDYEYDWQKWANK